MIKSILIIPIFFIIFLAFSSCSKEKISSNLYEESIASDLVFYQNTDVILSPAGSSPHGPFKLKFNEKAKSQLGSDGKLPDGATFKNGSLIVKEIYSGSTLQLIAVMKKNDSKYSGEGWLWAEYKPDGTAVYNISDKGKSCIACHSASINRDLTNSFDLH